MANGITTIFRRQKLAQITSGNISQMDPVTHIAFGSGGVDGTGEPIPPPETAVALNNQIAVYPIDSVTYPINTTARYTVTIPAADLPGAKLSEAALVDSGGKLCAIKTFYIKQKDNGVSFTFSFDDEF